MRSGTEPGRADAVAVTALPRTRTGKRLEIPVKRLIQGHALDQVTSPDAVDDCAALTQFTTYAGGPRGEVVSAAVLEMAAAAIHHVDLARPPHSSSEDA